MNWIYTHKQKPITYKTGNWDGKTSDFVICQDGNGETYIGEFCDGELDGHRFENWYDKKGFDLDVKILRWCNIPD